MASDPILTPTDRSAIAAARRAVLATIAPDGRPRLVPICFVLAETDPILYTPIDDKPKATTDPMRLARVRDITADPRVTILIDRWGEDWSTLTWLRLTGHASLLPIDDDRHAETIRALRARYPQYVDHRIEARPVIAIRLDRATRWAAADHP